MERKGRGDDERRKEKRMGVIILIMHRVNFKHTFLSEKIVDISMDETENNISLAFANEIKKREEEKVCGRGCSDCPIDRE
jgi:hypothetical protein